MWPFDSTTEQSVINTIVQIKQGLAVAVADVELALNWTIKNSGSIAKDITTLTSVITELGLAGNPSIAAAVLAANVAVAALNAVAAASNAGDTQTAILVAGYNASKQAAIAHAKIGLAITATVAPEAKP